MVGIGAVCKSKKKATRKKGVTEAILNEDYGLVGDSRTHVC
jgi:hypothetical protein